MKTEKTSFCKCEESEIDENARCFTFYLCKKCGGAIKRKENICKHYLSQGYCKIAELHNYSYHCKVGGDFTKCKNGEEEVNND